MVMCFALLDSPRLGYPDDLSVAIVENATTEEERVIHGTVSTISKIALDAHVKPPAVMIIGKVAGIANQTSCLS